VITELRCVVLHSIIPDLVIALITEQSARSLG
jgi:hypothetical protein